MKNYTLNFIIKEIQQMYHDLSEKTPTKKEFLAFSKSKGAFKKYFGSFDDLVLAASLPLCPRRNRYSDEDLVNALRKAAIEHPEIESPWILIRRYCAASDATYIKRIGSTPVLCKIVKSVSRKELLKKRYPIRYKSAPIILKWIKKRASWLKNA